jgi:putative tryptophan/tyrosine transport system substrate-binding protein
MVILAMCGLSPINTAEICSMIRRREFIAGLGGAAAWLVAARAQQPAMPVIGFLHTGSPEVTPSLVAGFRQGLNETGFIDGRNVTIEFRWAHNDLNRLPELAADLVRGRWTSSPRRTG